MSDGSGGVEIERRFLVRVEPGLWERLGQGREFRQGYLTGAGASVRIRFGEARGPVLTLKTGVGVRRGEVEDVVSDAMARALMEASEDRILHKARWVIGPWELDRFHGSLEGLTLLEIELQHESDPVPDPPEGIKVLREVTNDNRLASGALACMPDHGRAELVRAVYREAEG